MIELSAAQGRIEPIRQPLTEGTKAAVAIWANMLDKRSDLARPLDATARANFLHCHIRSEVERRVTDVAGVEATNCLDFFALRLDPDILLRFKYVGLGEPSNVPTKRQRFLARQEYDEEMTLALTGDIAMVPPTLLTCGYTLDGAEVGRIEIRRDCKGHLPWSFDIYGADALVEPIVFDGMADDAKPATVKSSRRTGQKGAEENQA